MFTKFAASSPSSSSSSVIEATSIQTVKLQSGDGEIFTVKIEVAMQSKIVKTMIQDLSVDGTQDLDWSSLEAIPLSNVTGPILRKVLTWMEYHQKTDPPVTAPEKDEEDLSNFTDEISEWDGEFVKVDQGTLFALLLAANYLNIKALRTVCCKTVANNMKKKTVEQIRDMYNIPNDFSAEEEAALRKENEWSDDPYKD